MLALATRHDQFDVEESKKIKAQPCSKHGTFSRSPRVIAISTIYKTEVKRNNSKPKSNVISTPITALSSQHPTLSSLSRPRGIAGQWYMAIIALSSPANLQSKLAPVEPSFLLYGLIGPVREGFGRVVSCRVGSCGNPADQPRVAVGLKSMRHGPSPTLISNI